MDERGLRGLLLAGHSALGAFAGASVGLRALTSHGEPTAVADSLVATNFHLAANISGHFTAQVTLNLEHSFDVFAQLQQLVIGQIFDANAGVDPGGL